MPLKSLEDLQNKMASLESFYTQRNINMLAWRDLYFMRPESIWRNKENEYIEPEPDEVRVVLPIAYNTVEGFRELLFTKAPAITVPAPGAKTQQQADAEHNESALLSLWYASSIYERLRDSLWHGLTDGWGVLQLAWTPNMGSPSPITVMTHDPFNVLAMPDDRPDEWKYVIHKYPRLAGQVREEWWPKAEDDKRKRKSKVAMDAFEGLEDTDEVTFIDYWDEEYNAVAITYETKIGRSRKTTTVSKWVKEPTKHGYGFLPWEIYFPCPLPFRTMGERMGVGILYVIEGLIVYMCKLLSEKATMLSRWEDPPLVTQTEQGPDFEPVHTEKGMHLRLFTDEKANYLVHPGPMPQIDTMAAQVSEYLEASALPKVLQGSYVGGVSGIAMSLLRNPTLMKVAFRQKAVERCAERLNSKMLQLIEKKASKPIYLWGIKDTGASVDALIDPDKIASYYRNEVKLSASLPTEDASTVNMLATLVQLKILSRQTARDVAQQTLHDMVPQSLIDEETKVLAEMIWNDEGTIMSLAQKVAQEIGYPYMQQQPNPMGGYGEQAARMPAGTIASQVPGMPGNNTQPGVDARLAEMLKSANGTGTTTAVNNLEGMNA